ncbi:autotransporter outer membrane beta-barrel domain-containing protein, partial [Xenorhabdus sp. 12]
MKKNNSARPIFLWMTLFFGLLPINASMAAAEYQEQGKKNLPDSWLSEEFNHQWGLAAIGAHYAYARGYTGKGINVGVLDQAVTHHPEFAKKLHILSPEDPWNHEVNLYTGIFEFGAHGNHVSGIIAASRDGKEMHGVAFDAGLITGKYLQNQFNRTEAMIQSNVRIINNSWGSVPKFPKNPDGTPKLRADGTIDYEQVTLEDVANFVKPIKDEIDRLSRSPIPVRDDPIARTAGLLRAAREGKLVVFATGNTNNYNVTLQDAGMPYFFPDALKNYLSVANLDQKNELNLSSTICGYTASYCLSAPGTKIYSSAGTFVSLYPGGRIDEDALENGELMVVPTYTVMTGTSMAAPHVSGAAAVLMQRFPYMTTGQISDVLKTTATDLGAPGLDEKYGWGMLNLKEAIDGPKMFITEKDIPEKFYIKGSYTETQFTANIPGIGGVVEKGTTVERVCDSIECAYDSWRNDISGHGGLTKTGKGMLELAGKNSTYKGPTLVENGLLQVSGGITSDVTVQNGATLSGNGKVGSIVAHAGANIAPGNAGSSGTLSVDRNVTFNEGSFYHVEVAPNSYGDSISSNGSVSLKGGEVKVKLENSGNLLSKPEVRSLLGQKYNILQANNGIKGQFSAVDPNYLFIGTGLSYQPDRVMLDIKRNATRFARFAQTTNERSLANAADRLNQGHPVYESILMSDTPAQARQAFQQLSSGQIHADIAGAQIDSSRYLRDTLNTRLRQADGDMIGQNIRTDHKGVWAKMIGNWQRAKGNNDISGYRVSNYGVLLGADKDLGNDWRLGVATGY